MTFPFIGDECPRIWDGLLCWPPTPANVTSHLGCPDYVDGFDVLVSPILFLSCHIRHPISFLTDGCWSSLSLSIVLKYIGPTIYCIRNAPDDRAHFLLSVSRRGVRGSVKTYKQRTCRGFGSTDISFSIRPLSLKSFLRFLSADLLSSVTMGIWKALSRRRSYTYTVSSIISHNGIRRRNPVVYGSTCVGQKPSATV